MAKQIEFSNIEKHYSNDRQDKKEKLNESLLKERLTAAGIDESQYQTIINLLCKDSYGSSSLVSHSSNAKILSSANNLLRKSRQISRQKTAGLA